MSHSQGHLQRQLGLTSAVSITVGAVIGAGIFLKPLVVAQNLPSVGWVYALWVLLGFVCLCGALAYAELGAMLPSAGGQYAFLREAWGRPAAFLYGWVFFWAINSGTLAALALAFADYLLPVVGIQATAHHSELSSAVAAAMIVLLALANHVGVRVGAWLQNLSTFAKLGTFGLIIGGGLLFTPDSAAIQPLTEPAAALTIRGLLAAFIGIFWAYEGWYQLPFNAAELQRPERNLPLGLIIGMIILMLVYFGMNAIYLQAVPFAEMRSLPAGANQQVPYLTIARIFSPQMADYLSLLVALSIMGAANPNILCSTRAFYAMGEDGLAPRALNWIHPKYGTPTVAIWSQAIWAVGLVWYMQSFNDITAFVVFDSFVFYALTVAAVYKLRHARPDLPRPYRCGGYPYTPAIFILVSLGFIGALLVNPDERHHALMGMLILAAGIPYYYWLEYRCTRLPANKR